MNKIYLRHKNDRRVVLLVDQDYNPISQEDIGQRKPLSKAFYVRFSGGFIGVYSACEGPVLFINGSKYLFTDSLWSISVIRKTGINEVSLIGVAPNALVFEYSVIELDPLDPWSEEQFDDFFIWLTKKRHDREFIEMWTDKN